MGPPGTVVTFDEYDHGYGRGSGVGAIPLRWKVGLAVVAAAALVWMLSAARRFGPPEPAERQLIPPRVAYVDALATVLSVCPPGHEADAVGPARDRARAQLCRRVGVPAEAGDSAIVHAAGAVMLPEGLVAAVLEVPRSTDDVMAVGRALAWLEGSWGRQS